MLNKLKFIIIFLLCLTFFLSSKVFANNKYFKCPEKILTVTKGQDNLLKVGSILGVNYVKFHINQSITIKFKYLGSTTKPIKIISDQKLKKNTLGYEVYNKLSNNNQKIENTYNFIKINDVYAFTRKANKWVAKLDNQSQKNYEYESSGRCIKIKKNEFELGKIIKTAKKEKKNNAKNQKK